MSILYVTACLFVFYFNSHCLLKINKILDQSNREQNGKYFKRAFSWIKPEKSAMSGKKKKTITTNPKSSILNYFSSQCKDVANEDTLSKRVGNTNGNNNKRKLKSKNTFSNTNKKPKILNTELIIISSDDSADENIDVRLNEKSKKSVATISKRKGRNNDDNSLSPQKIVPEIVNHEFIQKNKIANSISEVSPHHDDEKISDLNLCILKTDTKPITDDSKITKLLPNANISEGDASSVEDSCSLNEDKEEKIAYYLLNFRQILDTVLGNDDDRSIFEGSDDMLWIDKFNKLPLQAQKLYVRLYHRKVAWLRLEQINYPDISSNIHRVLKKLADDGFLLWFDQNNNNDLSLSDVLKLLPAPSLKDLAKSFKLNVNGKQKVQIQNELEEMCRKQQSVLGGFFKNKKPQAKGTHQKKSGLGSNVMKRASRLLGPCYKVASYPRTVFNRVLLVFDVTRGIDDETECSLTGSQNATGQGRHLQLSAILMAGMGKVSYPSCVVDRPTPIFSRRKDLLHYETAFQFQTDILSCVEMGNWQRAAALCDSAHSVHINIKENDKESLKHSENLPQFLRCFTAQWTYTRLRSLEVEVLQRLKNYKKAVEILEELLDQRMYCVSRRGHWWERLALNIDQHLKDPVRSLDVIHESLQDSDVRVGHKLALAQRVNKILTSKAVKKLPQLTTTYKTKLKPIIDRLQIEEAPVVEITGRLLPGEVQTGKSRFLRTEHEDDTATESTVICSVEELALSHYRNLGYDFGIHGEGGTFSTLFCLFLWDIIFMPGISDVFRTTYQTHPLDYHTDDFYLTRHKAIEERLKMIEDLKDDDCVLMDCDKDEKLDEFEDEASTVLSIMSMTWDVEYGKACAGMNWDIFASLEEAKGFVACIGGKVLSGIFRRLAKDLRHTRSGLPDLVVWNPIQKIYKMVEVKGPGDRLSTNQKLWIDELMRLGANIEVCKVIAIGGKKLLKE
uniref:fanconi-associated nuclease 1-like isoform X2 n=1 Tax=Styela clava TaxID=7725 RepID=UPI001939BA2C|nr:fanconi-associated nuclease 1-like isoform X2 [Styela clava]